VALPGVFHRALRSGVAALLLNAAMSSALAQHARIVRVDAEQTVAHEGLEGPPALQPGDPARGGALVADRQRGLCLLCHSSPFGDPNQQGNLAPSLAGVGSRFDRASLRLRIHNSRLINPESLMPAYGVVDPAQRVAPAWRGRAIFSPQQVEDVVAWLLTLE
jgi:sulfur-oxidizing protein SoxX